MTVGLEGEWGAGKSTVIRLLQEKLKAERQDKTFVFYIDAWEHEGDHLRRVFLEMLIERLKKWKSWSEDVIKKLDDILDRITSKKVSKTVEHSSQMTKFGKKVAFAALLVPLGA
jgi:predicted KAP-like P-loop ATPase